MDRSRGYPRGRGQQHHCGYSASSTNFGGNERRAQGLLIDARSRDRGSRGGKRGGGRDSSAGHRRGGHFSRVAHNNEGVVRSISFDRDAEGRNNGSQAQGSEASGGHRDYTPKPMTYGRLNTWAEMSDAGELVLFMSSQREQIETFLNQPIVKPDWFTLLVKATNHAITAQHQRESIKKLLDSLCRSRFFEHFGTYIEEKHVLGLYWGEAEDFFQSLLTIMEEILNKLPQYGIKCVSGSTTLLNNTLCFDSIKNNKILQDAITDFSKRAKEVFLEEKNKEENKEKRGQFFRNNESDKPPDNFVDIPVVPEAADLSADAKPFVRSAKTVGMYESVQDYLDIQFRLMRQDFIFPLREGIIEFKKNGCKKNYNGSDLRMYYDVHIVGNVCKDGIDHILQFDISKLKNIKWEFSKRLIFGSLLCLSKDNFETVLFATISHRDVKTLAKGIVNVNFKTGLDEVFNSTSSDVYIMAETTAYFESYCHVLEGLKEMIKTLPLQDYIIKCNEKIKPPSYLLPSHGHFGIPAYDLSALMKNKTSIEVPVLTTVKWPEADAMCLNKSQRDAAILALTKEVAVIQGPPGTGKTYVGLKVMEVLINNKNVISGSDKNNGPILVVCYTNHALDQFLEGVLEFCPQGIVRVGGKNSSEKLEQFNLKNLRQKLRRDKLFSNLSVKRSMYECKIELERVSTRINNLNEKMNFLETDIVSERDLRNIMKETHYLSLTKQSIRKWLNASSTMRTMLPQMIQKQLTILVLQWRDVSLEVNLNANMTVFQRASFYCYYLEFYKQELMQRLHYFLNQRFNSANRNKIQEIQEYLSITEKRILSDDELERVIPQEHISKIISFIKLNHAQMEVSRGKIIETWLLGLHKNLHSQLDDVQMLTSILSGEMVDPDMFDDDDASRQMQNDRIIIDDDDDDDEDDGYGCTKYNAKSETAMNNMSSVMLRADMLGINENILMEDGIEYESNESGNWQTVSYSKPLTYKKLQRKLKGIKPMTEEMESIIDDVWKLDLDQRFALYNLWIKKYKETLTSQMHELVEQYTSVFARKKEANTEEVLFLLRNACVIGMTTTGAAKHRAVLHSVGCRIIVVEEAAEVLESHIVTSLNKDCKHLILIGDHQQLRPNPTVYVLAKECGLEISLFERLIKNKVPHVLLKEQHRMRPEISKIMLHIYPSLQDHVSVKTYAPIRGVANNMFFIQHEHEETHVDDTRSKANIHEAQFLVALCQYLLHQEYSESGITILATYAGQVFAIKKVMRDVKFNHRVRVTAVDNFQGEENEIILLSLVRSNTEGNVGFLKVDNRVCVALSRARRGLYVCGNFDLLASQSKLWRNIVGTVRQEQVIGGGLPVVCPNHSGFQQIMTCDDDFKKCPEGGCGRDCEYKLACGHICARKCHGYDLEHSDYQCHKRCSKQCVNGHPCQKKCFQDCGKCMVKVQKQIPFCGHDDSVPCSVPPIEAECSQKCLSILECEHDCPGRCGQCRKNLKHEKCVVPIMYLWPCGHAATVPCFMKPTLYPCQKECGADLECGHKCSGKCSVCLQGAVHVACEKKCEKKLPCGHTCPSYCGVSCLPCTEMCPAECRHGACFKTKHPCSHFCAPCKEPCQHKCTHGKCNKLCSDICDRDICLERCKKRMKCTHFCSGLCGELCVCAECENISILHDNLQTDEKLLAHSDDEKNNSTQNDGSVATDTLVNETEEKLQEEKNKSKKNNKRLLIKIPTCKHVFYVDELDKYVLNFDPEGCSYILCPVCSKPILKCMHYENNNKGRHEKREIEKAKLKSLIDIKKGQIINLRMSQRVLEDSLFMSGFHSIDCALIMDQIEVQAVSFKLKCAFILCEIMSLVEESLSPTQLFRSHKDAVLAIKNRLTNQQKSEFMTELMRCFWENYLIHLESLASRYDIDLPVILRNNIKVTKEKLKKLKPIKDLLVRAHHVVDILRRRIKETTTEETVKARCLLLEQTSARVVKVMQSQDEDMLCDLIEKTRKQTLTEFLANQAVADLSALRLNRPLTAVDLSEGEKTKTRSLRARLTELMNPIRSINKVRSAVPIKKLPTKTTSVDLFDSSTDSD